MLVWYVYDGREGSLHSDPDAMTLGRCYELRCIAEKRDGAGAIVVRMHRNTAPSPM